MKLIAPIRRIMNLGTVTAIALIATVPIVGAARNIDQRITPAPIISITGQIIDRQNGVYTLQHKTGRVLIDLSGWPVAGLSEDALGLMGDKVTATGNFDEAFLRTGTLEADSLYNFDRHSYSTFVGSNTSLWRAYQVPEEDWNSQIAASLVGSVTMIGEQELTMRSGTHDVTVKISPLLYNPFDDVGGPALQVGDKLRVGGVLSPRFLENRTLDAYRLTTIDLLKANS